jgi:hypothetical protein
LKRVEMMIIGRFAEDTPRVFAQKLRLAPAAEPLANVAECNHVHISKDSRKT